ncbi:DnaJ domain-containing protein [Novosphingobium sp. CF614]|nr:DnaJ domain-containing protein [Novosphingobium sp. CF614]
MREFNAGYDYFDGMNAEQIFRAQSPLHGWESQSRAFRPDAGVAGTPRWADFTDPLEAIGARARDHLKQRGAAMKHRGAGPKPGDARFTSAERRALEALGLDGDIDRKALRMCYTRLLRQYHPDHNGGDHSHSARLQGVVEAYQLLRKAAAFA